MTATFTFKPLVEPTGEGKFRTRKAQFGDGYAQVVADGLNNEVQTWPLSFAGKSKTVTPILGFLRAHAGSAAFYWTPPLGTQGLYRCARYSLTPHGNDTYTLECELQEVFAP